MKHSSATGFSTAFLSALANLFDTTCSNVLTNERVSAIVSRFTSNRKGEKTVRERQKELSRRRKRREETLRARRKAAITEAAAKKGK